MKNTATNTPIPEHYQLLAGLDRDGIVQCGLVVEMSSNNEVSRMVKHIKTRGYREHYQLGGVLAIGCRLGEDTPPKPEQATLSFA